MHQNNFELFIRHGLPLFKPGMKVLEVGPDWSVPFGRCKQPVINKGCDYCFTDIVPRNKEDAGYVRMKDEYTVDIGNETFDIVFSLSVIEHVRKIWTWVKELKRVLKPGGYIILVNPVSWPFHESPVDCWRVLPEGYKALFEELELDHVFSWVGNVAPLESYLRAEHGSHEVVDCVGIAQKSL